MQSKQKQSNVNLRDKVKPKQAKVRQSGASETKRRQSSAKQNKAKQSEIKANGVHAKQSCHGTRQNRKLQTSTKMA